MILVRKIRTVVLVFVSWIVYFLSYLSPRDKKTWVFIGWHKSKDREIFADNSKYLFLHISNKKKDIRPIWIAQDNKIREILINKGYESYTFNSIKGIYYSLRAGYTIIDAIMQIQNWRYSGGSKVIQLWHADGIKSLDLGNQWSFKKWKKIIAIPGQFKKILFFITSSPYIAKNFTCPSFKVSEKKVRITGLPRYDIFYKQIPGAEIDSHNELEEILKKIREKNPRKIIQYTPTFRRSGKPEDFLLQLKLPELNKFLVQNNYFLLISTHPKFSTIEWSPENTFSNILFFNMDRDNFSSIPKIDILITDYSSICLEFLLLNKPTIFYVYDLEEYKKDPGLPEEFWNMVPGPRVKTFDALLNVLSTEDNLKLEREKISKILFTFKKGEASENVFQEIIKDLN